MSELSRFRIKGTTIGYDVVILIGLVVIGTLVYFGINSANKAKEVNTQKTEMVSQPNNTSDQSAQMNQTDKKETIIPATFEYEGNATDEVGNKAHYKLSIKSDFSSASLSGSPYSRIEQLPNGRYQWTEGSIMGLKMEMSKNSCTLYNIDGSYFCTLGRNN